MWAAGPLENAMSSSKFQEALMSYSVCLDALHCRSKISSSLTECLGSRAVLSAVQCVSSSGYSFQDRLPLFPKSPSFPVLDKVLSLSSKGSSFQGTDGCQVQSIENMCL